MRARVLAGSALVSSRRKMGSDRTDTPFRVARPGSIATRATPPSEPKSQMLPSPGRHSPCAGAGRSCPGRWGPEDRAPGTGSPGSDCSRKKFTVGQKVPCARTTSRWSVGQSARPRFAKSGSARVRADPPPSPPSGHWGSSGNSWPTRRAVVASGEHPIFGGALVATGPDKPVGGYGDGEETRVVPVPAIRCTTPFPWHPQLIPMREHLLRPVHPGGTAHGAAGVATALAAGRRRETAVPRPASALHSASVGHGHLHLLEWTRGGRSHSPHPCQASANLAGVVTSTTGPSRRTPAIWKTTVSPPGARAS